MKIEGQLFFYLILEIASAQFTSNRRLPKTPCDVHGTALVEQFFNVIFTEFQHSPPSCTCVQMCADRPTYCYPNGCFKKVERKTETSPVSSIQQDVKTVFLVNNDRDVIEDLMENVKVISPSGAGNTEQNYQSSWTPNLKVRINPVKEIVFKYKRLPKLQMKYNIGEQVKHTRDRKADIDLSKTRWPTNKQINRQISHERGSNYLMSVFPETKQPETPKYFKRYLAKRENHIGLDISALYLFKDASNFTVEALIDNLIEGDIEDSNRTLDLIKNNSSKIIDENNNNTTTTFIKSDQENPRNDTDKVNMKIMLTANHIGNDKDQSEDKTNYTNFTTAPYFEMISTLSKEIEKQNNVSVEIMEHITGKKLKDAFNIISDNILSNITSEATDEFKTSPNISKEEIKSTTNVVPTSLGCGLVINNQVKKSKQRIVRKIRNRKLN